MRIAVIRHPTRLDRTFGQMWVDDKPACYTLEPPIREVPGQPVNVWKVQFHTALPFGTFDVELRWSPHFKAFMPHVVNVPGFTDVMIHFGDFIQDTEGCTLVGKEIQGVNLVRSIEAFAPLWWEIAKALFTGQVVTITYAMAAESAPV